MIRVMSVFGTRPEAIKMCPLIIELERREEIESLICLTGQHKEMLDQVMDIFGIKADFNLNIMKPNQTLTTITTRVLEKMEEVLVEAKPDIVLVHGDTSTSFAVALAAFYHQIPVGHVEAGLRTYNKYSPFPEEMNRNLTGKISELHFAPTQNNKRNLELEHITEGVFVTGNTVIDAFKTTIKNGYKFKNKELKVIDLTGRRVILMTAHRRENLGEPLKNICKAIKRIAGEKEDVIVIYPLHLNPKVRSIATSLLGDVKNVHLIPSLDVEDMHNIMNKSFLVMTDSGGLQEEAPFFGIPVLVMRTETERPEAVEAGTVKVIGVEEEDIYSNAKRLLEDKAAYDEMAKAVNPYGDGYASEKICDSILNWYHQKQNENEPVKGIY